MPKAKITITIEAIEGAFDPKEWEESVEELHNLASYFNQKDEIIEINKGSEKIIVHAEVEVS
jgi:hypothetical protein